jgi:hypothetical protein
MVVIAPETALEMRESKVETVVAIIGSLVVGLIALGDDTKIEMIFAFSIAKLKKIENNF